MKLCRYSKKELDEIKNAGGQGIKDVMTYLNQNDGSTLDDALKNISNGAYAGGMTEFISNFKANGVNYITTRMNLDNDDTGAIGGADADGGSRDTTETGVVPDPGSTPSDDPLVNFQEIWPVSSTTSGGTTTPYIRMMIRAMPEVRAVQSFANPLVFQIGANSGQSITVNRSDISTDNLGIRNISMVTDPDSAIGMLENAINLISSERSRYGAIQNRLEHAMSVTNIMSENLVSAESRIRDADIAKEMMHFTKNNIIAQAAQSMLSQANQMNQGVLQLLR